MTDGPFAFPVSQEVFVGLLLRGANRPQVCKAPRRPDEARSRRRLRPKLLAHLRTGEIRCTGRVLLRHAFWDHLWEGNSVLASPVHVTLSPWRFGRLLTVTRAQRSVASALRVHFALLGGCLAGRPLHEELVFAESALPSCRGGIQRAALVLEGAPRPLSVRVRLAGQEGGRAVLVVCGWECPEGVRGPIPALRCRGAII